MADPQPSMVSETSSQPLKLPAEQELLFREILSLFEKRRVPYAVAGAFALREHTGIHRDTKDLDLFLTSEHALHALDTLRTEGLHCETCDAVWLYKAHRNGFFVDLITGMSNATIVVDNAWIQRSKPAVIYGVPSRVVAAEELVASKLFVTRRERFDGADIAHLIYVTRGRLDWQRIMWLAGENWEMLFWALVLYRYAYPAQTEFVPGEIWSNLIKRFEDAISNPDRKARFRGSLIDDKMFAIDVNDWGLDNLVREYRDRRLEQLPLTPRRS